MTNKNSGEDKLFSNEEELIKYYEDVLRKELVKKGKTLEQWKEEMWEELKSKLDGDE